MEEAKTRRRSREKSWRSIAGLKIDGISNFKDEIDEGMNKVPMGSMIRGKMDVFVIIDRSGRKYLVVV